MLRKRPFLRLPKLMPVNIYRSTSDKLENEKIAWLCNGEWELAPQIEGLSKWLEQTDAVLMPAEYIADVGFCWRRNAGGGAVLEPEAMRRMADLGMSLYLSEYADFADEFEVGEANQ